jgi:hypothetical protein
MSAQDQSFYSDVLRYFESMRGGARLFCTALHGVAFSLQGRTTPAVDPCVN